MPRMRFPCVAGLEGSGGLGIGGQLACLAACVIPVLALSHRAAASSCVLTHLLAAGLAASRAGLWTFDLAVSQMLQERVADREMGARLFWLCWQATPVLGAWCTNNSDSTA